MSALVEKTAERHEQIISCRAFHLRMAYACLLLVGITAAGFWFTSIHLAVGGYVIALIVASAMLAPLPVYWHEKGRVALRESTLVIAWELLLAITIPLTVLVAARLRLPLEDSLLVRADHALGINVPGVMAWASRHWIGSAFNWSYGLLVPLLTVAAFLPAFMGRVKHAREFLVANMAAFTIGIPLFALLPAIGPWYYYHTAPTPEQLSCQLGMEALRLPAPYMSWHAAGIVCFPSFHVIWAILSAVALWTFRPLRIPVGLLAGMIVVSTLTTGWHYFADVLAGMAIAVISLAIARTLCSIDEGRRSQ